MHDNISGPVRQNAAFPLEQPTAFCKDHTEFCKQIIVIEADEFEISALWSYSNRWNSPV